ncbi:MAG: U32 family peptidase [bacterium]|nr:U32 family peptidase [bacterium]
MRDIEILAPAGSFETLKAAINGGCDAVYVGGSMFGARASAVNFQEDELVEAIHYVHLHGKQLFLTVNTLLKDKEIEDNLLKYLKRPYEEGLDAVIVQDVGVMNFIHSHFPDLQIHASTQMTLTMSEGADLFKDYGITRLVTSRELTLDEIKHIRETTNLEIESFVHGALCYSYSGQCLMSSMLGGRSGNRGRCAQTCRMQYELKDNGKTISDKDNAYLLSPKDMCTLDIIPELVESGIDSFKIEGRMKRPEYSAYVASLYRKYVDLYQSLGPCGYEAYKKEHKKEFDEDVKNIMDIYNRGSFSTGYYENHNSKKMMSTNRPNHNGVLVGRVEKIQGNQATIKLIEDVNAQDLLEIRGDNDQKYEYTLKDAANKGRTITSNFKFGYHFKKGDEVYRTKNDQLLNTIAEKYIKVNRKVPMSGFFYAKENEPLSLTLTVREHSVTAFGEIAQAATNQPANEEKLRRQLNKTNATAFEFEDLYLEIIGDLFIPVGHINELRRQAIAMLEEQIADTYRRNNVIEKTDIDTVAQIQEEMVELEDIERGPMGLVVVVSNEKQLKAALRREEVAAIYYRMNEISLTEGFEIGRRVVKKQKPFYLVMPHVFRKKTYEAFKNELNVLDSTLVEFVDGFLVRSYEELYFVEHEKLKDKDIILDYSMYTMNSWAQKFYQKRGLRHFTTPVELNFNELKGMTERDSDFIVYGHIPLMTSANCVVKNTIGCTHKTSTYELKDRMNKNFIVLNYCKYCYNVIYNADPIALISNKKEVMSLQPRNIRLDFTVEDEKTVEEIIKAYALEFLENKSSNLQIKSFTKGHFKRGVE